ncbi:LysR substrate-binding domain-containing protein [Legionella sp. PATHC035]|uniref:LysR substrate-binding domain-containing protein n=1 Tax=Legionella sp. PATHC035 TaxID=2992040 RepID=UPI0022448194|nr:LysR substrate-binding domain-containing protein [Legionella sp. PATHC035]MCW8409355.1 LysR substrate-binding domain-containing protein [Legionella sp. PATHC035]
MNHFLPDLNDLFYFCRVVDEGSFTKASQGLMLTKSKLSRRISELENHLGVRLLNRSTRTLSLTDIGRLVYEHSIAMVNQASCAQDAALQAQVQPKGRIHVTCPTLFAQSDFGLILIHFMQKYSDIQIHLYANDRKVDLIEEGFDVALRFQINDLTDSNLIAKKLGESTHVLVATPNYLNQNSALQTPQDLTKISWLGKTRGEGYQQIQFVHQTGEKVSVQLSSRLESNEWVILKQAALGGLGVALLPLELCQQEINSGAFSRILADWSLSTASLYLIYPSKKGLTPALRHFIDFVSAETQKGCAKQASVLINR